MIAKIKSLRSGESGVAMLIVVGFMGLSVPLLLGALALGGSLSADSRVKLELAKKQYSNIGALEYVRYLSDAPENWNDWLEETGGVETIDIGDETVDIEADGNGVSDYGFLDYCIFGETEVEIGERSDIQCSIGSNGDVDIEKESTVSGSIVSGGNVTLDRDVTVYGDVTAVGTVTLKDDAMVMGNIVQGVSLAYITGPIPNYEVTVTITDEDGNVTTQTLTVDGGALPLRFTLTAGGANIYLDQAENYTLVPGSYGSLQVEEYATLNLRSGYYAFDYFSIDEHVTINLTVIDGEPIVIDVAGDLDFDEYVTMAVFGGTGADIAFRVQDEAEFEEWGVYLGTYFTFRSSGDELEAGENASLTGALYGMEVEVDEDSTIIGLPSVGAYLAFFGL